MAHNHPVMGNPTGKHRPKRRHHGEGSRAYRVQGPRQRPWRCALRMGRDPLTGRPQTRYFWGTSAREAEADRDEYRDRLRRAGSAEAAERTVGAVLDEWYAERSQNIDPSTRQRYWGAIVHQLRPSLGHMLVTDLDAATVAQARASWRSGRRRKGETVGDPLSASSSNLVFGILREALGPSVRLGVVADPTADLERRRKGPSPARFLDAEQARKLLAAVAKDPLALYITVSLALGTRRGEALGMRWPDIDLERGTWTAGLQLRHMPPSERREGEGPYRLVTPKAAASMGRVVSLPAFVTDALKAHKSEQAGVRKKAKVWVQPGDLVFCDGNGQAWPPSSISRRFSQLAERAGLGHLRLHDLRHSAATIMLEMGVPERVVQDVLGHQSAATTRGYTHVVRKLGQEAADVMDRAVGQ